MGDDLAISDAEWQVMNVLWERSPALASDVIDTLASRVDWSPRTVKTLLHRMVKKGVLRYSQRGREYLYEPTVSREECIRRASRSFLDRVFGGEAVPFLEYFVRDGQLKPNELARLKRLLDEESKKR